MAVSVGTKISYSHLQVALDNLTTNQNAHCPANYTSYYTSHNSGANSYYSNYLSGYDAHYTSYNNSWNRTNYTRHYGSWESDVCDKNSTVRSTYYVNYYSPVDDSYYPNDNGSQYTYNSGYNSVTYSYHSGHDSYNRGDCGSNNFDKGTHYSGYDGNNSYYSSRKDAVKSANYSHRGHLSYRYSN